MTKTITLDTRLKEREKKAAFQSALADMGVTLTSSSSFERAFARAMEAADDDGRVPGDRLQAIVDDAVSGMEMLQGVADSFG